MKRIFIALTCIQLFSIMSFAQFSSEYLHPDKGLYFENILVDSLFETKNITLNGYEKRYINMLVSDSVLEFYSKEKKQSIYLYKKNNKIHGCIYMKLPKKNKGYRPQFTIYGKHVFVTDDSMEALLSKPDLKSYFDRIRFNESSFYCDVFCPFYYNEFITKRFRSLNSILGTPPYITYFVSGVKVMVTFKKKQNPQQDKKRDLFVDDIVISF